MKSVPPLAPAKVGEIERATFRRGVPDLTRMQLKILALDFSQFTACAATANGSTRQKHLRNLSLEEDHLTMFLRPRGNERYRATRNRATRNRTSMTWASA